MSSDLFLVGAFMAVCYGFPPEYLTGWLRTVEITSQPDWAHKITGMVLDSCLSVSQYEMKQ